MTPLRTPISRSTTPAGAPLPRWRGRMTIPYSLHPRPKAAPLNSLAPSTTSVPGRPNIGQPMVAKSARAEPFVLGTERLGEAQRDRERTRLLDRQAKSQNCARKDVDDNRQIRPADEHAGIVDDLDKVDVGGRVVDLANRERMRRSDIAGPRLEPPHMLGVRRARLGDRHRVKQQRDSDLKRRYRRAAAPRRLSIAPGSPRRPAPAAAPPRPAIAR